MNITTKTTQKNESLFCWICNPTERLKLHIVFLVIHEFP